MSLQITKTQYDELYDEKTLGVMVLKNVLKSEVAAKVVEELEENGKNFVTRPVQYGKERTLQMLSAWDFERKVLKNYQYLKAIEDRYAEISRQFRALEDRSLQSDEVRVNASLYESGSVGIGPHRDNTFSVNFTVIFVLSGDNAFFAAEEKNCVGERRFEIVPGDCVVLRGPRSAREHEFRPVHYVKQVTEKRFIITFREINHEYLYKLSKDSQLNA